MRILGNTRCIVAGSLFPGIWSCGSHNIHMSQSRQASPHRTEKTEHKKGTGLAGGLKSWSFGVPWRTQDFWVDSKAFLLPSLLPSLTSLENPYTVPHRILNFTQSQCKTVPRGSGVKRSGGESWVWEGRKGKKRRKLISTYKIQSSECFERHKDKLQRLFFCDIWLLWDTHGQTLTVSKTDLLNQPHFFKKEKGAIKDKTWLTQRFFIIQQCLSDGPLTHAHTHTSRNPKMKTWQADQNN